MNLRMDLTIIISREYLTIQLICPKCGARTHQIDRKLLPEITLENLAKRVVEYHAPHHQEQ